VCDTYGEKRDAYMISIRKPEGLSPLEELEFMWVNTKNGSEK
jgi:hypothetical protein